MPGYAFKPKVIYPLALESQAEARCMADILQKALAEYAGKPEERFLARLNNAVAHARRNADRFDWGGWEGGPTL